ncbi:methionyl-tRNA formyltransferase [Lignipirellula cremea]|uniref:Methionyl-tRNA formyltransferase n=1 Tax=Lignipirellula cremea TaxID=2528010 RepID=A0A518DVJ6_9BACT|nr:methionyl-tRNA formyltransferase [Lignipirellula cremea]QDU95860.1 Methionyl-tRNA formyltransferase [Lignipirellula cremea]
MRLVVMGAGPFAVPMFEALLDSPHEVAALVTRPQRQVRTRGDAPVNPMRQAALRYNLAVFDPENANSPETLSVLQELAPDLLVVCDFGQILKSATLASAPLGGINLHGSLLPRHRGASPVQAALYEGDAETGVSVIHMTPRLDGGPCLVVRRTAILPGETAEELEPRLSQLGVEPVLTAIDMLAAWDRESPIGEVQDPALATRAPRLAKTDGEVDWSRSALAISHQIRAFKPWPKTYTHLLPDGAAPVRILLDEVEVLSQPASAEPGRVVSAQDGSLLVATGDGLLSLRSVQPAGKRVMPVEEFLRGRPLKPGDRFGMLPPSA